MMRPIYKELEFDNVYPVSGSEWQVPDAILFQKNDIPTLDLSSIIITTSLKVIEMFFRENPNATLYDPALLQHLTEVLSGCYATFLESKLGKYSDYLYLLDNHSIAGVLDCNVTTEPTPEGKGFSVTKEVSEHDVIINYDVFVNSNPLKSVLEAIFDEEDLSNKLGIRISAQIFNK